MLQILHKQSEKKHNITSLFYGITINILEILLLSLCLNQSISSSCFMASNDNLAGNIPFATVKHSATFNMCYCSSKRK